MRVQSPISGSMTGVAGGMVFQHYHGHTYGRALPAIFHYGPTPAQYAAQTKYYGILSKWLPVYKLIKPYIPRIQFKQTNPYNKLYNGVFDALGTFSTPFQPKTQRKFGFDTEDRLLLSLGDYTLYYQDPYYYLTFYDFSFVANVDFTPLYAHALYLCPDRQGIQYARVPFNAEHLTFYFNNVDNWFPDLSFEMYVALSDDQYFSNFFF